MLKFNIKGITYEILTLLVKLFKKKKKRKLYVKEY